jgi:uncharacterized protein (DUF1015 family)
MATIKPFKAIRPNPLYATGLIQTSPQVQSVAGNSHDEDSMPVLKIALEIGARHKPETPEGQARAYEDIRHSLHELVKKGLLQPGEKAGIYVYEVVLKTYRQTGIWAVTDIADYTGGIIKTHELTFADSVRRIKNYRYNTGLEGSPVLFTYQPHISVNRIIAETIKRTDKTLLSNHEATHMLWKIEDEGLLDELTAAFAQIETIYLADGHHRLESAAKLVVEQRGKSEPVFDSISSLYMATDQLRIAEFDRVVMPSSSMSNTELLTKIGENFEISASETPIRPDELHDIGMYAAGKWYELKPRFIPRESFASTLDASILQEQLLAPVFGIDDPVNDKRLKCIGGAGAMDEIRDLLTHRPDAIAFTLCPLSVAQLMQVADAGEILPPKSTWIDPKVPYGLLLYRH